MKPTIRFLERHLEELIACFCLTAVACFVFVQVLLRYGFGTALTWTEELSGWAMVWAVYMGAALAVRERFHIRIMAGVVALPRVIALPVVIFGDSLWLAFNLFMVRVSIEYLGVLWARPSISPSLGIDLFWPETIVLIGHALMSVRLLQIYWSWNAAGRRHLPGMSVEFQTAPGGRGE